MKEWETNGKRRATSMSKLEEFTKAAMIGVLANEKARFFEPERIAKIAVSNAKATLKQLELDEDDEDRQADPKDV